MLRRTSFSIKILFSMFLGAIAGAFLKGYPLFANLYIKPIGDVFLNLIRFIATPLVFLTVISGVISMKDVREIRRTGARTIVFYLLTTFFAVMVGLVLANAFKPFFKILSTEGVQWSGTVSPNIADTVLKAFPSNLVSAFVAGDMLQVLVAAVIFGAAILSLPEHPGAGGVQKLESVAVRVMEMILKISPFGVFSLIAMSVVQTGPGVFKNLLMLFVCVYVAFVTHILIVYIPLVYAKQRIRPLVFLKEMLPAILLAFSSASSISVISENLKCTKKLGAGRNVCDFVIPLGATLNMDGTGIYQGVCVTFIAACYGMDLTIAQCAVVTVSATLMSIGTAGVPGAGMIMLAAALESVGVPVAGIALVAGIDRLLDMGRTAVNILGDSTCSLFLSPRRNKK